jgi:carboxymethylenebutenolidase
VCHGNDSRPPAPGGGGTAASSGEIVLTAADGNRFAAHAARAGEPTGAGVVIMPDIRGLHAFYRELAVRFAEAGIDAVALDYFGRTAGIGDRSDAFEFRPHVDATTPAGIAADVAAAADYLRSADGGAVTGVVTVGFCFGGGYSWRQAADTPGLAGAIGFYGRPGPAGEVVDRMSAPLLMLVAGADAAIPVADDEALAARARAAGVDVDMVVYDGAPHSFFDRSYAEHAEACADAWRRVREFVAARAGAPGT